MKHLFIVNPVAGPRDSTEYVTELAQSVFSDSLEEFEIYVTGAPMDACRKIAEDVKFHDDLRVYACGGDGTLNECVNGVVGLPNAAVTHLPCGTGNDFIKTFGEERPLFSDLKNLIDGEIRPMDAISCNGRYSINICSVGIDARIGTEVHKYSSLPLVKGIGGYLISMLVNVIKGVTRKMRIYLNEKVFSGEITLVCACNGRWYGGTFNPVPTSRPDDGVLDFLVVDKISRLTVAKLIKLYATGRYAECPEHITYMRGTHMEIDSDEVMVINVDGEAIYAKNLVVDVISDAVNFIFPKNMHFFDAAPKKTQECALKQTI